MIYSLDILKKELEKYGFIVEHKFGMRSFVFKLPNTNHQFLEYYGDTRHIRIWPEFHNGRWGNYFKGYEFDFDKLATNYIHSKTKYELKVKMSEIKKDFK